MEEQKNIITDDKKKSNKKVLIFVVTSLVILIIMIFVVAGLVLQNVEKPQDPQDLITVVATHYSLLRQEQVVQAYDSTAKLFKENTSLEEYQSVLNQVPALLDVEKIDFYESYIDDEFGRLLGELTTFDQIVLPVLFYFVKEDGEWKIVFFELNPQIEN